MNKNYTSIILLIAVLLCGVLSAQEVQKNYINYQGVARDASNDLMANENMNITIGLKFGAATSGAEYEENHNINTDANGVFSLLIGNGNTLFGNYSSLPWGGAATFVTVSINGNEIGTTEMMAVPYAISSGDADDQSAAEVLYDNSVSGLAAITTQEAIDELVSSGSVDADADPTNEIQTISFDAGTNELSLSDGGSVTIPSGGTDADADPSNELQTLSFDSGTNELSLSEGNTVIIPSGGSDADADPTNEIQTISFDAASNKISLTDGGEITIPSGGTDADADPTNELQTLSFDVGTNELSLSDGNSVTIPSGGVDADADPENEIDVTRRHGILIGDDGIVDGLVGTADGQVAKWDAGLGNWVAGTDEVGAGGGSSPWSPTGGNAIYYSDGNVGIGTSTPNNEHHIHSSTGGASSLYTIEGYGDGPIDGLSVGIANGLGGPVGLVRLNEDGPLNLGTNTQTRMSIRGDGQVGIGTQSPTALLDVAGDIRSRDLAGTGQRNVMADADGNLVIGAGGGGGASTGLETIDEGDGLGWRLIGRNPSNFGPIGLNATDVSTSSSSSSEKGATGDYSMAMGQETTASGIRSTAMGHGANAIGSVSVAMGEETEASGEFAVAMGDRTRATEQSSTALGAGTWASGTHSTAMGNSTVASGGSATAIGNSTRAESLASMAIGRGNVGGGNAFTWEPNDPLFEIGNGTAIAPNNALTVLKNGNLGIGIANPVQKLDVDGDIRSSGLSGTGQRNVVADADGNLVIGTGGSSGSSLWTESSGNIFYDAGPVGIGTDSPESFAKLHVKGKMFFETPGGLYFGDRDFGDQWLINKNDRNDLIFFSNSVSAGRTYTSRIAMRRGGEFQLGYVGLSSTGWLNVINRSTILKPHIKIQEIEEDYARLEFKNSSQGFWHIAGRGGATGDISKLNFYHHDGTTGRDRMTILGNGNVGVGTSNPSEKLEVQGNIKTSGEVHGPSTGEANMVPIAYGRIADNGDIEAGSGNFTISKTASNYFVRVQGKTLTDATKFSSVVSRLGSSGPGFITTGYGTSGGLGSLIVNTYDIAGSDADAAFSFVIYQD